MIKLTQDIIFVREHELKSDGGLFLIDKRDREVIPSKKGTVLNVGPKCHELKPGLDVFFEGYAGEPMEIDGESILMMREKDVLAVVSA